jgi:four helix bundle protein
MAGVRNHVDFHVWKLSDEVRRRVRPIVARPAFQKEFKLRDQLSEAAEGPCPHIAEGFSRFYPRDFARFVRIAKGSLSEVIEHMGRALAKGIVTEIEFQDVCSFARRARRAGTKLILYLETADPPGDNRTRRRSPKHPERPERKDRGKPNSRTRRNPRNHAEPPEPTEPPEPPGTGSSPSTRRWD